MQFWPRIMWNLTSFGIGSARIICVIASKQERENVACVAYSSSFLSKICRNQYAFRVVLLFFFLLAVVLYMYFFKVLFSQWQPSQHSLRTLFSSSLSQQVELVDGLRANQSEAIDIPPLERAQVNLNQFWLASQLFWNECFAPSPHLVNCSGMYLNDFSSSSQFTSKLASWMVHHTT